MSTDQVAGGLCIAGSVLALLWWVGLGLARTGARRYPSPPDVHVPAQRIPEWHETTDPDLTWDADVDQAVRTANNVDRGLVQLEAWANRGAVGRKEQD